MNKRDELEKAILNLKAQRAILGDATVDAAIEGINMQLNALNPPTEAQAQRKQATILFADVSGFTAMSETMDAEDVQTTMNALWQQVDQAILDHNGHIDKHIGDAVMALWGVDEAREDDPEQAIRAALAMQTAVKIFAVEQNTPLKMRIGINTGPVLLGEVGTTAEFTAMGDAVNVASRLEHAAPIGGILISHDSYRHVRGIFDVLLQEPLTVKGKIEPLQVYVVQQAKSRVFRPTTRGVEGVEVRMVGRDAELEALQERWQTAVSTSQTTLMTIIGDAGVGKSRLLHEFGRWLDEKPEPIALFRGRSAEQTKGTPHFLLRDLLATRFEIHESDSIAAVRQKFEKGIGELFTNEAEMKAHILGQWLGYDFGDTPHLAAIQDDAEQLKNRGLLYLSQFWAAMGEKRPLILFLEDIHWADTSSLDAISEILRREPSLPLLVVALTRPSLFEHRPAWRELGQGQKMEIVGLKMRNPAYHFLTLDPLPSAADRELLTEILHKVDIIPEALFEMVASRAEGNPFYMEELVKMLIDNKVILTGDEIWQIDLSGLVEDQIPGTLTGVLQARLDKLEPNAKETLQRASVVGRAFWDTAVAQLGDDQYRIHLHPLQTREFIYKQNETAFVGTVEYLFKHDLLRDVTYQTVLKQPRRSYHGQVAAWLAEAAEKNGRSNEYAALIGKHYQAAGLIEKAAVWYGQAGQHAVATFVHEEAIHYLSLALKFTSTDNHAARFTLLKARQQTYAVQGNGKAQQQDIEQLATLANFLGITEQARCALWQARYFSTTHTQTISYAQTAIELGQRIDDVTIISEGYQAWGWAVSVQKLYSQAEDLFQTGLQLAKQVDAQEQVGSCLYSLGIIAQYQGKYAAAQEYHAQAVVIQHKCNDHLGEGATLNSLGFVAWQRGDSVAATTYHKQALAIRRKVGDRFGTAISLVNLGYVANTQEKYAIANEYFEEALIISYEVDEQILKGVALHEIGIMAYTQNNPQLAETYYQQALTIWQASEVDFFLVEGWAGLSRAMLSLNNTDGARQYIEKLLDYLQDNPRLNRVEDPMRTLRFAWEVLVALGETANADHVLTLAAQLMQEYIDKNDDPAVLEMYLNQPHHKVLWTAWMGKKNKQPPA